LGVKGEFGQSSYTAQELYEKHGLDRTAIVKAVKSLL
jgi:transketolase C-terminal domain/subunit